MQAALGSVSLGTSVDIEAAPPKLDLRGLCKHFGGVKALRAANLTITHPGEVHGLIGENGAGKSTLLGILSGQLRPDAGEMLLNGAQVLFNSPADAVEKGITMVSQETSIVPHLSVTENIFLHRRLSRGRCGVNWVESHARARATLDELALDYDPRVAVGRLRPDQQQMIEIARAIATNPSLLILDEPTSSLTDDQVQTLFATVRRVAVRGVSTIFVSHRLRELFDLTDRITVLRDGETIISAPSRTFTPASLVSAMLGPAKDQGREAGASRATGGSPKDGKQGATLRVQRLTAADAVIDVELTVQPSEIVGITGIVGSGRSQLLETIFGLHPGVTGEIWLNEAALVLSNPREAIASGIGFVPPNRREQGIVHSMSVEDNLMMLTSMTRSRFANPATRERRSAALAMQRSLKIKAASPAAMVRSLSGGNQQKVVLGKNLARDPILLLLDEPTRGVDVGAKSEIYAILRRAAAAGTGILVSSSENEELLSLCDRILVMFRGRIVAEVSADQSSEAALVHFSRGGC